VLGALRCEAVTSEEWAAWEEARAAAPAAHCDRAAAAARELALASFRHDLHHFNALHAAAAPSASASDNDEVADAHASAAPPVALLASCHGVGNALSALNDGRSYDECAGEHTGGTPDRHNNCALLEVLIRGWPVLIVVTLVPIAAGEELLMSYGDAFWREFAQRRADARAAAHASAAGGGSAAAVQAALPAPPPPPPSPMQQLRWLPFGGDGAAATSSLFKADALDALCPLLALCPSSASDGHIDGHNAAAWALAPCLRMSALTKGDDVAAALAPALARCTPCAAAAAEHATSASASSASASTSASATALSWPSLLLLAPAPSADAAARGRLARLAARLAAAGKAARVDGASASGHVLYIMPCDAPFARSRLEDVAAAAAGGADAQLPAHGGEEEEQTRLFAFVVAPAPRGGGGAAVPQAVVVPQAAEHRPPLRERVSCAARGGGADGDGGGGGGGVCSPAAAAPHTAPPTAKRPHSGDEDDRAGAHPCR
jgi:hypothetical protein